MTQIFLALAILFALADWYSVWQKNIKLEAVFKPLTMGFLVLWVVIWGLQEQILSTNLIFFVVGLGLCLIGDIFLFLPSENYFVPGLAAFLLGHIGYLFGFGSVDIYSNFLFPFMIYLGVIITAAYGIIGKLVAGLRNQNKKRLIIPLIVYGVVICLMLGSAGYRFFDSTWTTTGAYLVAGGALMFFISDVLNAWERFVRKFRNDRLIIMATYHLGQFGLAIGAALHFAGKLPG